MNTYTSKSSEKNNQQAANSLVGKNAAFQLKDNRSQSIVQAKKNETGLPDQLKSGIENLSGHSMDDVKVHYNSDKPAQLNAHAYAQGTEIHLASGQEKHLPHEAWHVVQQKQGRVKATRQMKGGNINDEPALEKEADIMGAKAIQKVSSTSSIKISNKKTGVSQLKHTQGCGCSGCCGNDISVQLKKNDTKSSLFGKKSDQVKQLRTTINIKAGGDTVSGESGQSGATGNMLKKWPKINTLFEQHVAAHEVPKIGDDGNPLEETYSRDNHACAEPNAFAKILNKHNGVDHVVNKAWLDALTFPELAVDDKGNQLQPCVVCKQWVTAGAAPLMIKNVKPEDPIINDTQLIHKAKEESDAIKEESAQTEYVGKIERYKGGESVSFDGSSSLKSSLGEKLKFEKSLKANKGKHKDIKDDGSIDSIHEKAWEGIIHKNQAKEFVSAVKKINDDLLDCLVKSKEERIAGVIDAKDAEAIGLMTSYYTLCTDKVAANKKTPDAKIVVQLIKELADAEVEIEGELSALNRAAGVKALPEEIRDMKLDDIVLNITEEGQVEISNGEYLWDSST